MQWEFTRNPLGMSLLLFFSFFLGKKPLRFFGKKPRSDLFGKKTPLRFFGGKTPVSVYFRHSLICSCVFIGDIPHELVALQHKNACKTNMFEIQETQRKHKFNTLLVTECNYFNSERTKKISRTQDI